jgi:hypothetical protein
MGDEKEAFLSRWSRLKREAPEKALEHKQALEEKKAAEAQPAPALPAVESLTPQSEFAGFMHPKVEDKLRRVALKKLFSDPHFSTPDPFEPFSGDWTTGETIAPELLAQLNQARTLIFTEPEKMPDAQPADAEPQQEGESKQDEPRRQDA